ncbi:endonuclease VII domain-containing protein [Burkholderia anthina]|uniref:endonuclease VII domain-containing protein n=1 Tax=Burkholderia anthina TaxID=179879 RepID=UPI001AA02F94|nr:endonuclease VII domain-containing protein [Burkholderia anthina]QTD90794.1 endonuclease VII domain-containing protein [Burkholderia anthina]
MTAFSKDKRRGHQARCKECRKAEVNAWRTKNRDAYNASERRKYLESPAKWERHLKSKYGITAQAYMQLLEQQGGACAICTRSVVDLGETLAVDHDHETGAVRGLLCAMCNRMLGCARDAPDVLRSGAAYLERNSSSPRETP